MQNSGKNKKRIRNIVYMAPLPFDGLKQRPQELVEELSEYAKVYYIEPSISLLGFLKNRTLDFRGNRRMVSNRLEIIRLDGAIALPIRYQNLDLARINTLFERFQLRRLFARADVVVVGYEPWIRVIPKKHRFQLVYDKMDDNSGLQVNSRIKRYLQKCDKETSRKSDLILTTAKKLYDEKSKQYNNVLLLPNALGRYFEKEPCVQAVEKKLDRSKRYFGYVGMISNWFDLDAIRKIANQSSENEVFLVGPNELPEIKLPNIHYIGSVPKSEVAKWIDKFDVCLYTFKKGEIADTVNPVKIYEYLAMNKPVIAVKSIETVQFGKLLYTYDDEAELNDILSKKQLLKPFSDLKELEVFKEKNSWKNRAEVLITHLKEKGD